MVVGRGALEHLARVPARWVAVIADLRAAEANGALAPRVPDAAGFERLFWQAFHGEPA
jgi:hypothetical protein